MDVQKLHCAENSIKICSLCFDTKFRVQANAQCASVACCSDTRSSFSGHDDEKRSPSSFLSSALTIAEEHFVARKHLS